MPSTTKKELRFLRDLVRRYDPGYEPKHLGLLDWGTPVLAGFGLVVLVALHDADLIGPFVLGAVGIVLGAAVGFTAFYSIALKNLGQARPYVDVQAARARLRELEAGDRTA